MTVVRAYARYVAPLTLLALVAFAPVLVLALRVPVPADAAQARAALRTGALLAGLGWLPLLVLVAAATAALDSPPRGQLAMLAAGLARLCGAIVPCLAAVLVIAVGGLALVVPGVLLLGLLSLTGAGREAGVAARLAASVAAVRARPRQVAWVIAATIGGAVVLLIALQLALPMPLPKKPVPAQLVAYRSYVRIAMLALALASPLPALALATARRS